jgi:hypothetical protein
VPARSLALACVLALAPAAVAQAATTSFGADLNQAADNAGTCSMLGQTSCTFYSGAPGPSFYVPASGTVTAVRVKTGAGTQGPMQILVMRSLLQNKFGDPGHPYFACCFVEQYGPTFTPEPNTVTTVPTSLPVVADPPPPPTDFLTNARGDFLALSVLAPDVPFPAHYDGSSVFSGFAPAPSPQTVPAPGSNPLFPVSNGIGYQILMNADLDTGSADTGGGGGGGGTPTTPPPTTAPAVQTPPANAPATPAAPLQIAGAGQLLGTTASIPVTCVLTTACEGTLTLTAPTGGAKAAAAKVYGKSKYKIAAGATKKVKVKLNAAGKRKLKKRGALTVVATTKLANKTLKQTVKLRRRR